MDPITTFLKAEEPESSDAIKTEGSERREGDSLAIVAEHGGENGRENGGENGEQDQGEQGTKHKQDEQENDEPERPSKRQKKNKNKNKNSESRPNIQFGKDPMSKLKLGLTFILGSVESQNFSPEVQAHAQELEKLLFLSPLAAPGDVKTRNVEPASPPSSSLPPQDGKEDSSVNPHTELPPPFALPDPKAFLKGPSPAMAALDRVAPSTFAFSPVPSMMNHSTTTVPSAPESHTLPALPQITEISLFNAPFTHTSALATYIPPTNTNSYEPLEFLGDAYLEVIATRLIHSRFPLHTVGQKAGLREILVKNDTLAEYSKAYGFPSRIRTQDNYKQHGPAWTKVLADVFEAYVACVVIQDATPKGFNVAEQWLADLWAPKILEWKAKGDGVKDTTLTHPGATQPDSKSDLNKLLAGKHSKIEYKEERPMEMIMPGNRQNFFIGVYLTGLGYENQHMGSGEGRSKQIAGMLAAKDALENNQDLVMIAHQKRNDADRASKKKQGIDTSMNRRHPHPHPHKHHKGPKRESNEQPINPHRGYNV